MNPHKVLGAAVTLLQVWLQACGGGDGGSLHPSPSVAWPMFRQNLQRTELSPNQTAHDTGSLKWGSRTSDQVQSSPALGTDGTIYVGSNDHKLYATNPNGEQKWSFTAGNAVKSSPR